MNNLVVKKTGFSLKKMFVLSLLILSIVLSLTSCKTTDKVQGKWYAQNMAEQDLVIEFNENSVTIKGKEYETKQIAAGFKNDIRYYGFELDGKTYSVIFPDKEHKEVAFFMLPDDKDNLLKGKIIYIMDRENKPNYSEYLKKYTKK